MQEQALLSLTCLPPLESKVHDPCMAPGAELPGALAAYMKSTSHSLNDMKSGGYIPWCQDQMQLWNHLQMSEYALRSHLWELHDTHAAGKNGKENLHSLSKKIHLRRLMPLPVFLSGWKVPLRTYLLKNFQQCVDFSNESAEHGAHFAHPHQLSPKSGRRSRSQVEGTEHSRRQVFHLQLDLTRRAKVPLHRTNILDCSNWLCPNAPALLLLQSTLQEKPARVPERQIDKQHRLWHRPSAVKEPKVDFRHIAQRQQIHGRSWSWLSEALETARQSNMNAKVQPHIASLHGSHLKWYYLARACPILWGVQSKLPKPQGIKHPPVPQTFGQV